MKKIIFLKLLFFALLFATYGQDNYLESGNKFLNNGEFDKAEKIFREGIKSDSSNLVYQCQLGLTLIQQKKYTEAKITLDKILEKDSINVAAIWYSGIGNFKNEQYKEAIIHFEKALSVFDKNSGQYYTANWFIGKSYSTLLKTDGLSYQETDRMFECYEEYLRLQPNANDAAKIREYVNRKKKRRPPSNVLKWMDL
jgi:tetratricopeptide (TPR) repeat protein